ncbi:hypothetical protein CGRA01v4_09814 [Colletotrichum graminicola]|uniref:Uncharacterized protein n=1 Tax=Colletotrichum graminicola (strain M1.001 / M2 / FGSC 10212) TaxID=645133 RepID=E3QXS9_COLGM|nr:uncharacterized protein GLRG_10774 [Colletotrichum graminicola M1.001]EFQ35630.1 hypothetical protein GLRG_10774 [Colletotrichum graminicola M1.001]WDK18529.1 hypothetical protein CGRA01v4_09814 [Colletotrichum graminicola]
MGSKNIDKQPLLAKQPSAAISASRSKAPSTTNHLKSFKLGSEHDSALQDTSEDPEINNTVEDDNLADMSYEELESLEHRIFKRMYADRNNRIIEIFFSRWGNKIQGNRSKKARRQAKHLRASREEKMKMVPQELQSPLFQEEM